MKAANPYKLLSQWRQKQWLWLGGLLMVSFVAIALGSLITGIPIYLTFAISILTMGISYAIFKNHQPTLDDVISLVHEQNRSVEYSARLLLTTDMAEGLAQIQKEKVQSGFSQFDYRIPAPLKAIQWSALFSLCLIGIISILFLSYSQIDPSSTISEEGDLNSDIQEELALPFTDTSYLKDLTVTITPPIYTGLNKRSTKDANLKVEEGSTVLWKMNLIGPIDQAFFIIGENKSQNLSESHTYAAPFYNSEIYRYGFNSRSNEYLSDYYSIQIVEDEAPKIEIKGIDEYTRLPWQKDHTIDVDVYINDEYGLDEAFLTATVAKGSGESVKFREKTFPLRAFKSGTKQYTGSYSFSTKALDMEPGSELYFFIKAKDNCPHEVQWTKSKTYFVAIQDTTEYEYVDDAGMQVDLMPDFFRSQRQIIIDSEKLLAKKNQMNIDSFKRASNELGYDQKMLRLKYGQFLGEESESGIAIENEIEEEHDEEGHKNEILEEARNVISEFMHDHDHEEEEGLLMATKGTEKSNLSRPTWVEELSHNHDNAEEATFHDVSVKTKLKAALSEMWNAELHLRLYDPKTSLPYQYESLKLLQEIKNHARIYVHRIGFDPPPIKETEKRLTGKQDQVTAPVTSSEKDKIDAYEVIKECILTLGKVDTDYSEALQNVSQSLAVLAIDRIEVLPVLSLIQSSMRNHESIINRNHIRSELIKILPTAVENVHKNERYSHEITRHVAKKISR